MIDSVWNFYWNLSYFVFSKLIVFFCFLFIPESSKGCALFTTSRKGGFPLRIAYAHGRRAFLMKWRHQEEWISLNTDTANGFELEAEVNLQETPTLLTILSGTNPSPR